MLIELHREGMRPDEVQVLYAHHVLGLLGGGAGRPDRSGPPRPLRPTGPRSAPPVRLIAECERRDACVSWAVFWRWAWRPHRRSAVARRAGPSQLVGHPRGLARPDGAAGRHRRRHGAGRRSPRAARPRRPRTSRRGRVCCGARRRRGRGRRPRRTRPRPRRRSSRPRRRPRRRDTLVGNGRRCDDAPDVGDRRCRQLAAGGGSQRHDDDRAGTDHDDDRRQSRRARRSHADPGLPQPADRAVQQVRVHRNGAMEISVVWSGTPTSPCRSAAPTEGRTWVGRPPWRRRCPTPAEVAWPRSASPRRRRPR